MADSYIGAIVAMMFVAGVVLMIVRARHKSTERKQWENAPATATKRRARN
jgi:large-conductance mechanosensitive channel